MNNIKALIFDVFGTVVDWRTGIARCCEPVFRDKGIDFDTLRFADLWRAEYDPAMERIRSGSRGYVALDVLHRENLERVLEVTGMADRFDDGEKAALNHAWEKLPPWPDSVPGLVGLRRHRFIAPCSNGSIALMMRLARFAALPWDAIVGAEIAGDYKPAAAVYKKSVAALGLRLDEVMMVAAHNGDLQAARQCGLATAFILRPNEHGPDQTTDLKPEADWDVVTDSITGLAGVLEARSSAM